MSYKWEVDVCILFFSFSSSQSTKGLVYGPRKLFSLFEEAF